MRRISQLDNAGSHLATRAAKLFLGWRNLKEDRRVVMEEQLKRIIEVPTLSRNIKRILSGALGDRADSSAS